MRLQLDALEQALRREFRLLLQDPAAKPEMLAQLGLWSLSLPAEVGGLGLGVGTAVVAWEELGRRLVPTAATDTMLAADVVAAAGPHAGAEWLEQVAAGRVSAVLVGLRGARLRLRNGKLHGCSEALLAPPAPVDAVVAISSTARGPTVFRLAPADSGARFSELAGSGCLGQYVFDDADAGLRVGAWGAAPSLMGAALPATRVRHAAYLVGAAERMLRLTAGHVRERQQFGRRLVDFQSVLLRLAEVRARIEAARMLAHHAGWRCDNGSQEEPFAAEALAAAAELALHASRTMMQLHGARGMLAPSETAAAYETVAREAVRFGTPSLLWREAGRVRLKTPRQRDDTPADAAGAPFPLRAGRS